MNNIVNKLRDCADGYCGERCGTCRLSMECRKKLMLDAASLIEKLTSHSEEENRTDVVKIQAKGDGIAHILVEVKGGMVQAVFADRSVDVDVADLDEEDNLDLAAAYDMLEEAKKPGWKCVW